jgi:Domain of unknown function (DUF6438)
VRIPVTTLGAASLIVLSGFGQSSQAPQRNTADECIASLSGFPKETSPPPRPAYLEELGDVTLEYFASGCYGSCPAFTLTISKNIARFKGRAYVRAKGEHQAKVTRQQFETFLRAWYDGNFYRMRDNYCDISCPDGSTIVVTDVPESSIRLISPGFTKRVYECFSTNNDRQETPKPPDQYFELARQLQNFAKAQNWLY